MRGSHTGLGHNPAVLLVIADRLAQPEGTWVPFEATTALASPGRGRARPEARPLREPRVGPAGRVIRARRTRAPRPP